MAFVIGILGVALVLLLVTMMVLLIQRKTVPTEIITIASLIAGGLIGFLTPHVADKATQTPHVADKATPKQP